MITDIVEDIPEVLRAKRALEGNEIELVRAWKDGLTKYQSGTEIMLLILLDTQTDEINHVLALPRPEVYEKLSYVLGNGPATYALKEAAGAFEAWIAFWGKDLAVVTKIAFVQRSS